MKKIIYIIVVLISFVFSGCGERQFRDIVTPLENDVVSIEIQKNYKIEEKKGVDAYNTDTIKRGLKVSSEYALKNNKSHFMLVNEDLTNNLIGFPINTYADLKELCFKTNRDSSIKNLCIEISEKLYSTYRIVLLDNPSYEIIAFDAKSVLEEISKEPK